MSEIEKIRVRIHEYVELANNDETPLAAKVLLFSAVAYFLWPFDLIPDFIPIIGYLDDLIIVPFLIWMAFRQIEAARLKKKQSKPFPVTPDKNEVDSCRGDR